jgi:preprotein translocase subunit SecA
MLERIKTSVVGVLLTVQIRSQDEINDMEAQYERATELLLQESTVSGGGEGLMDLRPAALAERGLRVGRNDPCPCGNGKKYKQCHGKLI